MNETTDRAPWCPRCGGEMVHANGLQSWLAECFGCGFGAAPRDYNYEENALAQTRRLIRAELARQALEMRAHSEHFMDDDGFDRPALWASLAIVMNDYNWLGAHPLRLPGEGEA